MAGRRQRDGREEPAAGRVQSKVAAPASSKNSLKVELQKIKRQKEAAEIAGDSKALERLKRRQDEIQFDLMLDIDNSDDDFEEEQATSTAKARPAYSRQELAQMRVSELKALLKQFGGNAHGCLEKNDFVDRIVSLGVPKSGESRPDNAAAEPDQEVASSSGWDERQQSREELLKLSVSKLKQLMAKFALPVNGCIEKSDFVERLKSSIGTSASDPGSGATSSSTPRVPEIFVVLRTRTPGFENWKLELRVKENMGIGEFRTVVTAAPYDLPITLRTKFTTANDGVVLRNIDKVVGEIMLVNFHPDIVNVRVRSSAPNGRKWELKVDVPVHTTVREFRKILQAPPCSLTISGNQEIQHRPLYHYTFVPALDSEQIMSEVVLTNFETPIQDMPVDYWRQQSARCNQLAVGHSELDPRSRRGYSWSRSLAYGQIAIGERPGNSMRKGTAAYPFVIWVLGATDMTEADLAERGFFDDANWVDRAPTEVIIWGSMIRELLPRVDHALDGEPPLIRTMSYDDMDSVLQTKSPPDLVVLFMPKLKCPEEDDQIWETTSRCTAVPENILAKVGSTPVLITLRFRILDKDMQELRDALWRVGHRFLLDQTRCPFSSNAGVPAVHFDDNGWMLAVSAAKAAAIVLNKKFGLISNSPLPETQNEQVTALFWGIIDLKYDPMLPVLERVRVLETGDGKISKFSNDGSMIKERFDELYTLKSGPASQKYVVVSSDKKLTHDLIDKSGYSHIAPMQLCFPRQYESDLAQRILQGLGLTECDEDEVVVLKLCNRSRGAGVLVVPTGELEVVLDEILKPPADMEAWFKSCQERMTSAADILFGRSNFEEQKRHWWGNESPCFVVERYCKSTPIDRGGKKFDATMRVSFVIKQRNNGNATLRTMLDPSDLEVDWLGGYWKLPTSDMDDPDIRSRSVSVARSGTAPVRPSHLQEVYAALGDSMQRLFGGAEPTPSELKDWYENQPELAAFLIGRLGMSLQTSAGSETLERLKIAQGLLQQTAEGPGKRCVNSYLCRAHGVCKVRHNPHTATAERWQDVKADFSKSVSRLPNNANAIFCLGMANLELGRLEEAVDLLTRSLLLDPDFKAPYVNLGVAYIRQGAFHKALEISNAGLARHPDSPMCNYHVGVAAYQAAVLSYEEQQGSVAHTALELALSLASDELTYARESEIGRKRFQTGRCESPWLEADGQMLSEAEALVGCKAPAPLHIQLPPFIGWKLFTWRA